MIKDSVGEGKPERKERPVKMYWCEGCGGRFRGRDLFEVPEDHLTFFEGQELCRKCALGHGVV